ncbi:hypothetical protein N5P37_002006 [Trichoderma harzianum]|uniref:HNH nuclease domain-containing protein n=1 Tax=Trichoderma harzianum CBS 226.95 TaxID=983964 RepID=A0A2T4AP98_TRIHA|nr:hypothetical protein M431DRAFT_544110 [Trichoderma harzianum CBS 226.95]KAK0766064.1 hypothetical protein N5P37_002006 [Trichoderma harzianum]PTB58904.1 hypothetical protein M431DRAFT_544110 [Trichoderma harzianum CBS 226.95]
MAAAQEHNLESSLVERLLAEMDDTARMLDEGIPLEKPKVDYITDIDTRREIFLQIKKIQDDNNISLGLNAVGLAIILVAPIDQLQRILNDLNMTTYPLCAIVAASLFGTMHADGVLGIKAFVREGRQCHGMPSAFWERLAFSLRYIPASARRSAACPIRGTSDDVCRARIIPKLCRGTDMEFHQYISMMLRVFWDKDKAQTWDRLYARGWSPYSLEGRFLISSYLRQDMAEAKLALKPLAKMEDGSVIVQLFWLKESRLKPQDFLFKPHESVSFEDVLKRAGLENNQEWGPSLVFRKDGQMLLSGQLFILKGNLDVGIKAPDFELLQILWDLTQVAAICGAVNETDDLLDEGEKKDYLDYCVCGGEDGGEGEDEGENEDENEGEGEYEGGSEGESQGDE